MIKKNLKTLIITSVIILLPVLVGIILWDRLPDQMPMHWNTNGDVDSWGSKLFAVAGMPLILLAFQWLCAIVTGFDPKKEKHSQKILTLVLWIIPVITVVLSAFMYASALGQQVNAPLLMPILMGVLFMAVGNYMPKCEQNYTIGIKISWTLNSEENWNRTHRFAGRIWVVCGFLMILTAFLESFWILLGMAFAMALAPVIYSYMLYRKGI